MNFRTHNKDKDTRLSYFLIIHYSLFIAPMALVVFFRRDMPWLTASVFTQTTLFQTLSDTA